MPPFLQELPQPSTKGAKEWSPAMMHIRRSTADPSTRKPTAASSDAGGSPSTFLSQQQTSEVSWPITLLLTLAKE